MILDFNLLLGFMVMGIVLFPIVALVFMLFPVLMYPLVFLSYPFIKLWQWFNQRQFD